MKNNTLKKAAAFISAVCLTGTMVSAGIVNANEEEVTLDSPLASEAISEDTGDNNSDAEESDIVYGDLNNDNIADLTDLTTMSVFLMGDNQLSETGYLAADVDANFDINIADLARFKQYISKDEKVKILKPDFTEPDFEFFDGICKVGLSLKNIDMSLFEGVQYEKISCSLAEGDLYYYMTYPLNDFYKLNVKIKNGIVKEADFYSIVEEDIINYYDANEYYERYRDDLNIEGLYDIFDKYGNITDTSLRTYKFTRNAFNTAVFELGNGYSLRVEDNNKLKFKPDNKVMSSAVLYDKYGRNISLKDKKKSEIQDFVNSENKNITLLDVIELSEKESEITWEDLKWSNGKKSEENDKEMIFEINDSYILYAEGSSENSPEKITLVNTAAGEKFDVLKDDLREALCKPLFVTYYSNRAWSFKQKIGIVDKLGRYYNFYDMYYGFEKNNIKLDIVSPEETDSYAAEFISTHEPDGYASEEFMKTLYSLQKYISGLDGEPEYYISPIGGHDAGDGFNAIYLDDQTKVILDTNGNYSSNMLGIDEYLEPINYYYFY